MTESRPASCHSANAWRSVMSIMQPARIELQHGHIRNPGIGLELVAHDVGVEEQQRGAAADPADREDLVLAELLAAVDHDGGDAEARGIGQRVAGVADCGDEILEVAALDNAEAAAFRPAAERSW